VICKCLTGLEVSLYSLVFFVSELLRCRLPSGNHEVEGRQSVRVLLQDLSVL